jgi:hypothetical protein
VRKCDPSVEFVERYAAAIDAAAERLTTDLGIEAHYSPGFTGTAERVVSRYREIMEDRDPLIEASLALRDLVRLKDGPHDDAYRAEKDGAWQRGRNALAALGEGDRMSRAKPKSEWAAEDWQAYRDFYTL